ncbi:MAG: hypothetical protein KDC79_00825 [Cyclobacteriaceae bacterium]|nr:hypothetical protein [Cyclobacteriaceae bacterium]
MGHERVGILPKTKRWTTVVNGIASFSTNDNNVPEIAQQTLKNVQNRFQNIERDKGVQAAFQFLVLLSLSANQKNPLEFLASNGINLSESISPLQISKALSEWVKKQSDSNEYATFARSAAIDTITEWYQKNQTFQENLFAGDKDQFEIWRKSADGKGFCELSRLYFSNFTERYLKYFLERAASANMNSLATRNKFDQELEKHLNDISKHAFETAKITQSFAAGWFNKNAKDEMPSTRKIQSFLNIAFGKLKGELLREENKK